MGTKFLIFVFVFYYSEVKKTIGLCWRTRLSHGVSETGEGHLRHRRTKTRFHKSLVFRLWLLHCLNWFQAIRFPKKEAILVAEVVLLVHLCWQTHLGNKGGTGRLSCIGVSQRLFDNLGVSKVRPCKLIALKKKKKKKLFGWTVDL